MKKKLLSIVIMLCMVIAMLPQTSLTVQAASDVAKVIAGGSGSETTYSTLEAAFTNAVSGDTIQVLSDSTLSAAVTVTDKNLTLDLNGFKITGPAANTSYMYAFKINGTSNLTIKDTDPNGNGTIEYNGRALYTNASAFLLENSSSLTVQSGSILLDSSNEGYTIYNNSTGSINVINGSITSTGSDTQAIVNNSTGSVNITNGSITSTGNNTRAIVNNSTGSVNITNGSITSNGRSAILNENSGPVNISGGNIVINPGVNGSSAIFNDFSGGDINITGGTVECMAANGYAIYQLSSSGSINITGGTVKNYYSNGTAIYNYYSIGTVAISDSATIQGNIVPASATPMASVTSFTKTTPSTNLASFALTNSPIYNSNIGWVVYNASSEGSVVTGVTASNTGNALSLTGTSSLTPGIYYVAAFDRAHGKGESGRLALTVIGEPGAPTIGTPTAGNAQVTVQWTAPINNGGNTITGYQLYYGTSSNLSDATQVSATIAGTSTNYTITGLNNGTTYYFWVKAVNSVGSSVASSSTNAAPVDPDIALVSAAKTAIENGSYTMPQATATTGFAIQADLAHQINALSGMSGTGITVQDSDITLSTMTAAVAGNEGTPSGTNGSFTFTVALTKGVQNATTTSKSGTIIATVFTGVTDVQAVAAAKTAIENGSYTMTQATATTGSAIQAELAHQINALSGMSGMGITVQASDITLSTMTAAVAGNEGTPSGTNGSFSFTVALTKGAQNATTASKSGTIIATVYTGGSTGNNSTGSSDNSGGNNTNLTPTPYASSTVSKEGRIETDQQRVEGAPEAKINNTSEELKTAVFTSEEQKRLKAGENAKIILKIEDISSSVSDADKKLVENKLEEEQDSTQSNSGTKVLYVDISLYKQIGNAQETKVTGTSNKIRVSIKVPDGMWTAEEGYDRTFRVVRVHNGVVEFLDGTYDPDTHMFTFDTDQFSLYALTYQDTKNTLNSSSEENQDKTTVYHDFSHLRLTATAGKTVQKLSYAKVSGADGYLIYGALCGQELKEIADVKGTVNSYKVKNLKQGTYYKYQVKAYKIIDGKKVIISTSALIRSVTTSKIYGDPTNITTKLLSVTLTAGATKNVTYQLVLPEGKRMKNFASQMRYESTDTKIATINSSGKITAISKGSCYVYIYAQNGVFIKIKITVV